MSQLPRGGPDDETTLDDLQVPTYEQAPPTLEMRPSPFHPMASKHPTAKGMPSVSFDPKITEKPVAIVPPVIVGAGLENLAGPTEPDGYPLTSSWEGATDPELGMSPWIDAGPTDVSPVPRGPTPVVPAPGSPTFEISQSLQLEAAEAEALAARKAKELKVVRPKRQHISQAGPGPQAPTQVLPALKRKPEREGSDWPLVLGLIALGLVIAGLVGAVAYGVVRSMRDAPEAPASAPR